MEKIYKATKSKQDIINIKNFFDYFESGNLTECDKFNILKFLHCACSIDDYLKDDSRCYLNEVSLTNEEIESMYGFYQFLKLNKIIELQLNSNNKNETIH